RRRRAGALGRGQEEDFRGQRVARLSASQEQAPRQGGGARVAGAMAVTVTPLITTALSAWTSGLAVLGPISHLLHFVSSEVADEPYAPGSARHWRVQGSSPCERRPDRHA